jgi:hypothetical protein
MTIDAGLGVHEPSAGRGLVVHALAFGGTGLCGSENAEQK